jgi:aldehyde:ferredoxin oxidoreductase
MGAKRLKAISVRGDGKADKADEVRFREIQKEAFLELKESALASSLHALGSDANMDIGMIKGDVPVRNWSVGEDFDLASALSGPTLSETYLTRAHACTHCPIACKRVVRGPDGPFRTEEGPGPEYETCATFGTLILNGDLAAVIRANALCNRLGLDTISAGAVVAWAMEMTEKGLLTREAAGGLDLAWGNMETVLTLLNRIARREGFGDQLAEGSLRAAERIGREAVDAVVHVKGLELPMHDPRGFHGMGLAYMMSNRGACHLQHAVLATEQGMASWPQLFPMKDDYRGTTSEGKAELVFHSENYGILGNSLSLCHYLTDCLKPETIRDAFNAITGFDFTFADLMTCGARDWTLKRGVNNLLGVRAGDDALPKRILTPLRRAPVPGRSRRGEAQA